MSTPVTISTSVADTLSQHSANGKAEKKPNTHFTAPFSPPEGPLPLAILTDSVDSVSETRDGTSRPVTTPVISVFCPVISSTAAVTLEVPAPITVGAVSVTTDDNSRLSEVTPISLTTTNSIKSNICHESNKTTAAPTTVDAEVPVLADFWGHFGPIFFIVCFGIFCHFLHAWVNDGYFAQS